MKFLLFFFSFFSLPIYTNNTHRQCFKFEMVSSIGLIWPYIHIIFVGKHISIPLGKHTYTKILSRAHRHIINVCVVFFVHSAVFTLFTVAANKINLFMATSITIINQLSYISYSSLEYSSLDIETIHRLMHRIARNRTFSFKSTAHYSCMVDVCYLFPFSICFLLKLWNILPFSFLHSLCLVSHKFVFFPLSFTLFIFVFILIKFETRYSRSCLRNYFLLYIFFYFVLFCCCCCVSCFYHSLSVAASLPSTTMVCVWFGHAVTSSIVFFSFHYLCSFIALRIMAINWYAKWELIMSSVRILFCFCFLSFSHNFYSSLSLAHTYTYTISRSYWSNQNRNKMVK